MFYNKNHLEYSLFFRIAGVTERHYPHTIILQIYNFFSKDEATKFKSFSPN